jgi:hypothetical protein
MTNHFNALTEAEAERLAILSHDALTDVRLAVKIASRLCAGRVAGVAA